MDNEGWCHKHPPIYLPYQRREDDDSRYIDQSGKSPRLFTSDWCGDGFWEEGEKTYTWEDPS
jgi:hypothetical protein